MSDVVTLHRWDELDLEKVTEMISRKIVTGDREMLAQIYLKKGALVPTHSHESEQMTYVLQGALKFLIGGEEITVREGEVLHIPSWVEHQAEALDDTFELDVFTDRSLHDVGTRGPYDSHNKFDVPHLNNIYDSAPYLHDGRAATLEEIWTRYNPYDQHGVTNDMTKDQLNDLIEYLKTL